MHSNCICLLILGIIEKTSGPFDDSIQLSLSNPEFEDNFGCWEIELNQWQKENDLPYKNLIVDDLLYAHIPPLEHTNITFSPGTYKSQFTIPNL